MTRLGFSRYFRSVSALNRQYPMSGPEEGWRRLSFAGLVHCAQVVDSEHQKLTEICTSEQASYFPSKNPGSGDRVVNLQCMGVPGLRCVLQRYIPQEDFRALGVLASLDDCQGLRQLSAIRQAAEAAQQLQVFRCVRVQVVLLQNGITRLCRHRLSMSNICKPTSGLHHLLLQLQHCCGMSPGGCVTQTRRRIPYPPSLARLRPLFLRPRCV